MYIYSTRCFRKRRVLPTCQLYTRPLSPEIARTLYLISTDLWFKHIHLSSIAKQVLASYINYFRAGVLEPIRTGVIYKMVVT
jgi:hypothetical protein